MKVFLHVKAPFLSFQANKSSSMSSAFIHHPHPLYILALSSDRTKEGTMPLALNQQMTFSFLNSKAKFVFDPAYFTLLLVDMQIQAKGAAFKT